MRAEQIVQFLKTLHARNIRVRGEWVEASCPLSRWTHANGHDSNPSFAVSVDPSKVSYFNCFSCIHGSLSDLCGLLDGYAGNSGINLATIGTREARLILDGEDLAVMPLPEYTEFGDQEQFVEWPDWVLKGYPSVNSSSEAMHYLKTGRVLVDPEQPNQPVSDAAIAAFDLRYDPSKKMIVAPYTTASGLLAGMRGRSLDPNCPKAFRHYDYTWADVNNAGIVWYNERALESTEPVIVVEGQFDAMNVWQVYPHVIAGLSSKVPVRKLQKLLQAEFVLFMHDNDETGQTHQTKYMEWLADRGQGVGCIEYDKKDPAKVDPDWLREELKGTLSV